MGNSTNTSFIQATPRIISGNKQLLVIIGINLFINKFGTPDAFTKNKQAVKQMYKYKPKMRRYKMKELITTALAVSGLFVLCYPIAMVLLNVVLTKMESEAVQ